MVPVELNDIDSEIASISMTLGDLRQKLRNLQTDLPSIQGNLDLSIMDRADIKNRLKRCRAADLVDLKVHDMLKVKWESCSELVIMYRMSHARAVASIGLLSQQISDLTEAKRALQSRRREWNKVIPFPSTPWKTSSDF